MVTKNHNNKINKAPKLCECLRFPRQCVKYYVMDVKSRKPRCLKQQYIPMKSEYIWVDGFHGFFRKDDAILLAYMGKYLWHLHVILVEQNFLTHKVKFHKNLEYGNIK